jgi:hypothetical protein
VEFAGPEFFERGIGFFQRPPSPRLRRGDGENGRSTEFTCPELLECNVRLFDCESFCFRFHRNARRDFEKFFAVAAAENLKNLGQNREKKTLSKVENKAV